RGRFNPEVPGELTNAGANGVGGDHQIIEQRKRAQRRPARDLQREIRRESPLARARDQRAVSLTRQPRVWIVEIRLRECRRGEQRRHVVPELAEGRQHDAHLAHRHRPRGLPATGSPLARAVNELARPAIALRGTFHPPWLTDTGEWLMAQAFPLMWLLLG